VSRKRSYPAAALAAALLIKMAAGVKRFDCGEEDD